VSPRSPTSPPCASQAASRPARYIGLLLDGARANDLPAEYRAWLEGFDLAFDERTAPEGSMAQRTVRFYFAYNSPYAFLANTRLARELAPLGVAIDYKRSTRRAAGPLPTCRRRACATCSRMSGASPTRTASRSIPVRSPTRGRACLGFLFAREEGRGLAYHDAVYAARFLEGRDVGDVETLTAIAEQAGLNGSRFVAALDEPRWAAALAQHGQDAAADEVFGFPFFVFRQQRFWGNDRIEWLVRALQAP
jgi:2-hydroxychromene-2-carboxylate isomerase